MNHALALAAALSLGTWALHAFVGGREVAGPLLRSALRPVPKYTSYYCWHLVTIVLFAMAAAFAYGAVVPGGRDVAALALILSSAFAVWSLALVRWKRQPPLHLPQWLLFIAISVVASIGFV